MMDGQNQGKTSLQCTQTTFAPPQAVMTSYAISTPPAIYSAARHKVVSMHPIDLLPNTKPTRPAKMADHNILASISPDLNS